MEILERVLKYVSIDTPSDSLKEGTESQRKLARLLGTELIELGLNEIYYDNKYCQLYGILRGEEDLPKIGFVAYLDTYEEVSSKNTSPTIIPNYDGNDITLIDGTVLKTEAYPDLKNHVGKTLITTSGSKDKVGIAKIMNMLQHFSSSNDKHGDILVGFTTDKETSLDCVCDFSYTVASGNDSNGEYVCLEDVEKDSEELVGIVNQFAKKDVKGKIKKNN